MSGSRKSMLKISIVEGRKQRRLVVEGKLVAPWSDELKAACERAASGLNGRELVIDLKNVTPISQQGENLLLELMKHGVRCRGCGVFTNQIVKRALDENLDLAAVMTRVQQARAAAQGAGAKRMPSGNLNASTPSLSQSTEGMLGRVPARLPGYDRQQNYYDLGFMASWETDL